MATLTDDKCAKARNESSVAFGQKIITFRCSFFFFFKLSLLLLFFIGKKKISESGCRQGNETKSGDNLFIMTNE